MIWIIEDEVQNNQQELVNEIKKQGFQHVLVKHYAIDGDILPDFNANQPVFFYGSLGMARRLAKMPWMPGIYCNLHKFQCSYYYAYLAEFILNQNYIMLPFGDLNRQKDFLFTKLAVNDKLFLRPNSGFKTFTGTTIDKNNWNKQYDLINFYQPDKDSLVIAAEPQNITKEWRLVVIDKKVVSGSQYQPEITNDCPQSVINFTQNIANLDFQPDPAYIVDIAQIENNQLKLIEINSMSCSGLYKNNLEVIVKDLAKLVQKDFDDLL